MMHSSVLIYITESNVGALDGAAEWMEVSGCIKCHVVGIDCNNVAMMDMQAIVITIIIIVIHHCTITVMLNMFVVISIKM